MGKKISFQLRSRNQKEEKKLIIKPGKDLGPIIANTAAFAFFKSILN